VQPAWEQADVLADLLTGSDPDARYTGTPWVTRLKARDLEVAALGEVHADGDDLDTEVMCLTDPAGGRYAKLVVRGEKVAGAIVLGAADAAAAITHFYDRELPVPADRLALLLGRAMPAGGQATTGPADLPGSSVVCACNSVSKAQLVAAWGRGARDSAGMAAATKATTGCGGCRDAVSGIAEWLSATG
jgi:assimilatory nitrate reductase electron transfer subunit